ncbi:MAG: hypothetical protein IIY12_06015, partial [Clostridia bacterium]|nr:hypothetical protein [Clostridia bacterium]
MSNQQNEPRTCSFCGQPCTGDKMFIAGIEPDTYICNDCVDACKDLLREEYDLGSGLERPEHPEGLTKQAADA